MRIRQVIVALSMLASLAMAFTHGGNTLHPAAPAPVAGDVFVYVSSGALYVTRSNTVDVDTLSIQQITTNAHFVLPGQAVRVTMSVLNTGTSPRAITSASLRFYTREFVNLTILETPATYLVNNNVFVGSTKTAGIELPLGGQIIAAGARVTLNFAITVTSNVSAYNAARANPLVIDGYVYAGNPPRDDNWRQSAVWSGRYQYAAQVTANWDTSGLPFVASVIVTPNPARATTVRVTVNFSEYMNTAQSPVLRYRTAAPSTFNITVGSWVDLDTWVGTFVIPSGQSALYDGLAHVAILRATDNAGYVLLPSYNISAFVIDTIKPTASLVIAASANVGMNFPVVLRATDTLLVTPSLRLTISPNIQANVLFATQQNGITWNGSVIIPPTALPAVGTVATFNIVGVYVDDAGNTNTIILPRYTVEIAEAVPVITTVNFDTVVGYPGMVISSEPYISVYIVDYKNVGLQGASIRVTVDTSLVVQGPIALYQVAATPYPVYRYDIDYPHALAVGGHTFSFGISDIAGVAAQPYVITVQVESTGLEMGNNPVPFPNPFSPNGDGVNDTTEIVYQLSKTTDVWLYIYDLNGTIVWRKFISRGLEGAHAGVNRVPWDGRSSFGGRTVLANGLYITHVVVDKDNQKKSLGRTKIFILK